MCAEDLSGFWHVSRLCWQIRPVGFVHLNRCRIPVCTSIDKGTYAQ